jgi:hypothetical protein
LTNEDQYQLIVEHQKQQLIDDPVKEGFYRQYTDHTGRFYQDLPIEGTVAYEQAENLARKKDIDYDKKKELGQFLSDLIEKEINKEIIKELLGIKL